MKRRACLLLTWTVSSLFLECWETLLTLSWNNSFLWPAFGVCRVHRIKHLFYEQILTFEFDWLKLKLTLELFDWSLIDLSTGDSCVKFKRNLLELFAMDFPNDGSESSVSFIFENFGGKRWLVEIEIEIELFNWFVFDSTLRTSVLSYL